MDKIRIVTHTTYEREVQVPDFLECAARLGPVTPDLTGEGEGRWEWRGGR